MGAGVRLKCYKPKGPLVKKIRMRGRISVAGNLYWQVYVDHPAGYSAHSNPWGWTPEQCFRSLVNNYTRNGYKPQTKPSCLSQRAPA